MDNEEARQNRAGRPISTRRIVVLALITAVTVLIIGLALQWLIYVHWMRESGSVRIVGTLIASAVTFAFVFHWQDQLRQRHAEMIRRFQLVADLNDQVRNALQVIDCSLYAANPEIADQVNDALDRIDSALRDALVVSKSSSVVEKFRPKAASVTRDP